MKFRRKAGPPTECGVKDGRGDRYVPKRGHDPQVRWLEREHGCADDTTFALTQQQSHDVPGSAAATAVSGIDFTAPQHHHVDFTPPHHVG
ncbi:hypothetical protein [Mycobacterium kyorinense]|uniref:Uncharacterized protein n=1 Tax=Mycobacterium kyorinense TaxID=487514 RepID=A0A1X1Y460_9MYCO|nr:hypothetical protein [Mycobacterium kyorinense]ORW05814.1 hypothetical protein AWC14_01885 [Mycobacterium kyorinense]